jgi:hypothetical protein
MKRTLIALLAISAYATSNAQFVQSEGTFESKQLAVHVVLLDEENGVAAASVAVAQGACSGSVTGIGKIASKKLTFTPYVKLPQGDACTVTVEFDKQWRNVKVTDNDACAPYHGASCSWAGQSAKKKN